MSDRLAGSKRLGHVTKGQIGHMSNMKIIQKADALMHFLY
jgi:hypothetical protein